MKTLVKLSASAVLIFIVLCSSGLKAQILYTDINPDTTVVAPDNNWGMYYVDLNHDGADDFVINHHNMLIAWNYQKVEMCIQGYDSEILCETSYNHYPYAYSLNDVIGEGNTQWYNPVSSMIILNENGGGGFWVGVTDKYIAVRLKVANKWHYGWIRMDVPADAGSYTVKDFAFNTVPNQPILAGEGSPQVSVRGLDPVTPSLTLSPNPLKSTDCLQFGRTFKTVSISIYDISGKLVEQDKQKGVSSYQLKNKGIKPGIYFIRLITDQGQFTSKLILQ